MNSALIAPLVVGALWLAAFVLIMRRLRQRRGKIGPAAVGSVYDMLHEDKRKAIELIVEERAEETDPERAMGDKDPDRRRKASHGDTLDRKN